MRGPQEEQEQEEQQQAEEEEEEEEGLRTHRATESSQTDRVE